MTEKLPQEEEDPRNAERVAMLKEAFTSLSKTLKSYGIYVREHKIARQFQTTTNRLFCAVPQEFRDTWLEVQAKMIKSGSKPVWEEDNQTEGFVFQLHSDGVRRLCLLAGLEDDEIERLTDVLGTNLESPEHFDSDMVTLLWDAELNHIRYVVAEFLSETIDKSEDIKKYQDLMNDIIKAAMATELPPGFDAREQRSLVRINTEVLGRISPEQIAATLAAADQGGGVDPFSDQPQDWVTDLRRQYEDPTVLRKFAEILHRGVAGGEAPDALSTFSLLLQALLRKNRLADVLEVLTTVRDLGQAGLAPAASASANMIDCLCQGEHIPNLVAAIEQPGSDPTVINGILKLLPDSTCARILSAGAALNEKEHRDSIVTLLAYIAAGQPGVLSQHLSSPNLEEVKMACQALVAISTKAALDALAPLRNHASPEMRLVLLRATKDATSAPMRQIRLTLLDDKDARVRAEAEQVLVEQKDPELAKRLLRRLQSGELKSTSSAEKRRVCGLLGAIGGETERRALLKALQSSGFFSGRGQLELCAAAAWGLAAAKDEPAIAVLEGLVSRRFVRKLLRDACNDALTALRRVHPPKEKPAAASSGKGAASGAKGQPRRTATKPGAAPRANGTPRPAGATKPAATPAAARKPTAAPAKKPGAEAAAAKKPAAAGTAAAKKPAAAPTAVKRPPAAKKPAAAPRGDATPRPDAGPAGLEDLLRGYVDEDKRKS